MFFEQEYIVFELLEVFRLDQSGTKAYNSNRNYDAVSFRFESDTVLSVSGDSFELSDNSLCYVPSNTSYSRDSQKDILVVVHFKSFNCHANNIECFNPGNPGKYRELFTQLLNCWNKREPAYKNECSAIFSNILSEIYKENKNTFVNRKIYKSVLYMEQNCFHKGFSLSNAAAKSYISETYFRKLFKQEFNISPKKYIINRRIEYAKALILAGYFSVREIADMCGYNDEKHFSTEFKKYTGVSPSKYSYNYGR